MQAAPAQRTRDLSSARWGVLVLLVISSFINYIDRGNLSIAAPSLSAELNLDPERLGLLFSAFFWTYATFQMVSGWLIDRYNVYFIYGAGFLLWSLATAFTGFAHGFALLFLLRLLLGMGESVAYPAYSKIVSAGFAEHQRGLVNSLIDIGTKCGPAIGTLIGGLVIARWGWRALFLVLGFGALVWLIPWAMVVPKGEGSGAARTTGGASILDIARQRSAWGTFLGLFCSNYSWYFLLTWLPYYLVKARGFSPEAMALMASLPFWGIAAATLIAGYVSDRMIFRGADVTRVRKTCAVGGLTGLLFMFPAALAPTATLCMVFLMAAWLCFGLIASNMWAITQRLAGQEAAGKWTGMQNMFGNFSGVVAPWLTGLIVARTGSFVLAFAVACGVALIGAFSYLWIVGRVEPIDWSAERSVR